MNFGNTIDIHSLSIYNRMYEYALAWSIIHTYHGAGRSRETVSRYVHEHEAAVNAVRVVIDAQNT